MRAVVLGLAMLALQSGYEHADEVDAVPGHFRYQRALRVPAGVQGQACVVVDGAMYTHTDGKLSALRIYSGGQEVPFALTESGQAGQEEEPARVMNLGSRGGAIVFDLAMPARAYTQVVLGIGAHDFYATAKVSGGSAVGETKTELGKFGLFDLRSQGLARSTTLGLQESTFAVLHVELTMTDISSWGKAHETAFEPGIVSGASVPPSREAQTLYTVVAETGAVEQRGRESVAQMRVAAHVPIERVHMGVDAGFKRDFLRAVTVTGKPDGGGPEETVEGEISRVQRAAPGDGVPAIRAEKMDVDALLGSDLRQAATVTVAIRNEDDAALPVRSVALMMRQRKICFEAVAGAEYVLRYGDPAPVRAPVYDYARLFRASAAAANVTLGPELMNADFRDDVAPKGFLERYPQVLWVVLLAVIAALGSVALRNGQRMGRRR